MKALWSETPFGIGFGSTIDLHMISKSIVGDERADAILALTNIKDLAELLGQVLSTSKITYDFSFLKVELHILPCRYDQQ